MALTQSSLKPLGKQFQWSLVQSHCIEPTELEPKTCAYLARYL